MSKYQEFMNEITRGRGCDECPLYCNGFCNNEIGEDNKENLDCGEILYRYLNDESAHYITIGDFPVANEDGSTMIFNSYKDAVDYAIKGKRWDVNYVVNIKEYKNG